MKEIFQIIQRPHITEKSTILREEQNKITLLVHPDANKIEIKRAVEETLKVRVKKVNIIRMKGKRKRLGRFEGKLPDWKKAIVTLAPGEKVGVFESV